MYYNKLVLKDGNVLFSNIISASLTTSCNTEDDIAPGSVCASSVDVEFWVSSNEEFSITQGTTFTYYKVDDSGKETKIGIFTCEKPEKDGQNQYKFTAYDNVTLLDKDVSDWVNNKVSFPITLSAFASALAKECGLSLANDVFVNGSYKIQKFTASSVTGRDLMKLVCQAGGCFGFANEDGNIEFGWFKENKYVQIAPGPKPAVYLKLYDVYSKSLYDSNGKILYTSVAEAEKIPYYSGGLAYADYTVSQIDKVQIKQSDNDVGVIYPADEEKTNALVIQGNVLLSATSDEQIRPCAQALYNHLKNTVYVPCSNISVPETLDIKCGDILNVTDGKKSFKTWVTSVKYSGGKCSIESVGNATRNGTSAVNSTIFNAKQKYLEIKSSIDGLNVKAGDLENNYTELSQDLDGLNLSVVKNGEVRTKFAADASSVAISTGKVAFNSNTLEINSTNFNLNSNGNVSASGYFSSNNGVVGQGKNVSILSSGQLDFIRTTSDGQERKAASIYGYGSNASFGYLELYGTLSDGSQKIITFIYGESDGSHLVLKDAYGNGKVTLNGGSGGATFAGDVEVKGPVGLGVDRTVSCQGLNCWDSGQKKGIVQTSFGNIGMVAFETPEPSFADSGSAVINENGVCIIDLDPRYAETIDPHKEPKWYITPTSEGNAWVEKNGFLAIVHGTAGMSFDWMCVSSQKGYSLTYAEKSEGNPPKENYEADYELDNLEEIEKNYISQNEELLNGFNYEDFEASLMT